jgi:hypothetical protein
MVTKMPAKATVRDLPSRFPSLLHEFFESKVKYDAITM